MNVAVIIQLIIALAQAGPEIVALIKAITKAFDALPHEKKEELKTAVTAVAAKTEK